MSTDNGSQRERAIETLRVVGLTLGIVATLFTIVTVITEKPVVALITAVIGAIAVAVYFVQRGYFIETVVAWLTLIVVGLVIFVLWPRTMTVAGVVYDANNSPISDEEVILIDKNGVRRETKTDQIGYYEFGEVPVGSYELRVRETKVKGSPRSPIVGTEEINIYVSTLAEIPTPIAAEATPIPPSPPPPTITPEPLDCRHPAITSYVFPQLEEVAGQRSFYGPLEESPDVFRCAGVYDVVHSEPLTVRIEYHIIRGTGKYGFWGIGTLNGYDASQFSEICLWAFSVQPDRAFRLKLKDTQSVEQGVDIIVKDANQWTQYCVDLSEFSQQGVDLSRLDNVNLGFEEANGSITVWVDDFTFEQ